MKRNLIILLLLLSINQLKAQLNPVGKMFDENQLTITAFPGNNIVVDPTANGGSYVTRPASAANNTMWCGPYAHLQGGNYLIQFRMKVSSNTSSDDLLLLDLVDNYGATLYGNIGVKPNMFKSNDTWQILSFPVTIPDNNNYIEVRGMGFQSGITDVSLDYINIIPGDNKGYYSNDLTITNNGALGVGTNYIPAGYQMAVNGSAIATSMTVQLRNAWPDYVFKSNYKLKPLSEIKSYIDQNHHLPEIPSSTIVEKDGLNLGEMNKLLLKKVEELTLYLIEKDNENKSLQLQINQLSDRFAKGFNQLKTQITNNHIQ